MATGESNSRHKHIWSSGKELVRSAGGFPSPVGYEGFVQVKRSQRSRLPRGGQRGWVIGALGWGAITGDDVRRQQVSDVQLRSCVLSCRQWGASEES